jgi:hypothetical protein
MAEARVSTSATISLPRLDDGRARTRAVGGRMVDSGCTAAQIAGHLNAEGFRPPKRSRAFTPNAVSDLLRALGIRRSRIPARRNRPAPARHEWWLRDLAAHLGMSEVTLDAWVRPHRLSSRWCSRPQPRPVAVPYRVVCVMVGHRRARSAARRA